MESTNDLRKEFVFKHFNNRFVVINGIPYNENTHYELRFRNVIFLEKKRFEKLSILDEKDQDSFYELIKSDSFIDGFSCRFNEYYHSTRYDFTYEEYKQIIKQILETKNLKFYNKNLTSWFEPLHIIRSSEIEARYNCTTTVVLNGEEIQNIWDDTENHSYSLLYAVKDRRPGYIVVETRQKYRSIPANEILHSDIGHPKDGIWICVDLIPKKYLDKIIIYLDHVDFSGNSTHRHERLKLDFKNPDPKVLDFMIKHGLCEKK